MAETKAKRSKFLTGVHPGKWCWLLTPNCKFSEDGEYSVDLVMSTEEARNLCKSVGDEVVKQANQVKQEHAEAKIWKLVWPAKDDEDEPGMKLVSFKQKVKPGYDFRVDVFDAKKKQLAPGSLRIGNGTKMKVCFSVRVVADNLTKRIRVLFHPQAVQIIELVKWEAEYGFDEEEGFTDGSDVKDISDMRQKQEAAIDPFAGDPAGEGIPLDDIPF